MQKQYEYKGDLYLGGEAVALGALGALIGTKVVC